MTTNFGAAAQDYASFRAGFPDSLFDRLGALGICRPACTVVDVGTGTGTLARGFALRGASVVGIDPDKRLLKQAALLDASVSIVIDYRVGTAEALPLPEGIADVVSAGQCWHWFDGTLAAREIARVLRPRGCVVVAHFDWLPVPGNVVAATERLIQQHNPDWGLGGGNGFHPESIADLRAAGFSAFESFSYEVDVPYTPEAWRGRIRASAGVGATLSPTCVEVFDGDLALLLERDFPARILHVPHRVFALHATRRSASDIGSLFSFSAP